MYSRWKLHLDEIVTLSFILAFPGNGKATVVITQYVFFTCLSVPAHGLRTGCAGWRSTTVRTSGHFSSCFARRTVRVTVGQASQQVYVFALFYFSLKLQGLVPVWDLPYLFHQPAISQNLPVLQYVFPYPSGVCFRFTQAAPALLISVIL